MLSSHGSLASPARRDATYDDPMRALILAVLLSATAAAVPVTYRLNADNNRLTATAGGQTVTLIDMPNQVPRAYFAEDHPEAFSEGMRMYDLIVRDFDNDGTPDALVSYTQGGNCCPPSYVFVSYKPGSVVRISNSFESWNTPTVEVFKGKPVVKVRNEDDGVIDRYGLSGGKAVRVDRQPLAELTAVAEMRIRSFDPNRPSLSFNVGGDAGKEIMTCQVWDRWNTLLCGIKDRQGRVLLDTGLGCDRYGILASKTRGYNDLVCGFDLVGRWNGQTWVFPDR